MSTFNGWPIVTLPTTPAAPKSIEWQLDDVVGSNRSPFSRQRQIYDWQQAQLMASVSYPLMSAAPARAWWAFLAAAGGMKGVFLLGDPMNQAPQNPGASAGAVGGSGQTGFTLNTSSSGLLPGDWFSLGVRLYMVTDVSGGALTIWPPIRESPADGTDLVITNTQGLFRLAKNSRKISVSVENSRKYEVTFEIEEAL